MPLQAIEWHRRREQNHGMESSLVQGTSRLKILEDRLLSIKLFNLLLKRRILHKLKVIVQLKYDYDD